MGRGTVVVVVVRGEKVCMIDDYDSHLATGDESGRERDEVAPLSGKQRKQRRRPANLLSSLLVYQPSRSTKLQLRSNSLQTINPF